MIITGCSKCLNMINEKCSLTTAATDVVGRQHGNRNQKHEMIFREKKMLVKQAAELPR